MAKLTGQTIADSYDQLLIVTGASGITSSLQAVESADTGSAVSSLQISTVGAAIDNPTASAADQGGKLTLFSDDGAALGDTHRLGVIEFSAAEDTSSTITIGARIEAIADAAWSGSENGADMVFYTTDGDASQTEVMRLTADSGVTIASDLDVDGTANLDIVDIDGAVDMASTLQVDGAITSSAGATITTADNLDTLSLVSTDADANAGPNLRLYRNSGSPAADDVVGRVDFEGRNNNSQDVVYGSIQGEIMSTTDGSETGQMQFGVMVAGTLRNLLMIDRTEVAINEDTVDVNFRVESDGNTHMLFVDGGNDRVGIGTATPNSKVSIVGAGDNLSAISNDRDNYAIGLTTASSTDYFSHGIGWSESETDNITSAIGNVDLGTTGGPTGLWFATGTTSALAERMRIDQNGRVLIGHTATLEVEGLDPHLQVIGTGDDDAAVFIQRYSADAIAPHLLFFKSRNGTPGSSTIAADDDVLGSIRFFGDQGDDTGSEGASIFARVNGTPSTGSNDMPSELVFTTNPDGSTATQERMFINNAGKVGIGETPNANHQMSIYKASQDPTNYATDNSLPAHLTLFSTDSVAADKGGTLAMGGELTSGGVDMPFAFISGRKENSTNDNRAGYFTIHTTKQASPYATEAMRINSVGNVGLGDTDPDDAKLSITGVASGDYGIKIDQDQATAALYIDMEGQASSIVLDAPQSTTAHCIDISSPINNSGDIIVIGGADALTTGSAIRVDCGSAALASTAAGGLVEISHDGASGSTANNLLYLKNNHASASGTVGLKIQQNANGRGINLVTSATDEAGINVEGSSWTSGSHITLYNSSTGAITGATGGMFLAKHTVSSGGNANNIGHFWNDDAASTGTTALKVTQDSTAAKAIDMAGGCINLTNNSLITAASYTGLNNSHAKTDGTTDLNHNFYGIASDITFNDTNQYFGELNGCSIYASSALASTGECVKIKGASITAHMADETDVENFYGLTVGCDVDAGTVDTAVYGQYIEIDLEGSIGNLGAVFGQYIIVDADTNPSDAVYNIYNRTIDNADWGYLQYDAPNGTVRARISAAGQIDAEGTINASQALDYAEYFESKDGNSIAVGSTVKLDGGKIVACEEGDTPLGVVRPIGAKTFCGGSQEFHWQDKFAKDDYGADVWEDYTITKWSEEITFEEYIARGKDETGGAMSGRVKDEKVDGSREVLYKKGDELPEGKEVGDVKEAAVADTYFREHKYHSDRLPEGVTAPDDAVTFDSGKRQKLNPDYDDSKEYEPREERDEWHIVGLLGQIPITKGQPTGNWIKMKDVSDTVEMYFVK